MECKIAQIQSAGISVANCIDTVLKLIKDNVSSKDEQKAAYTEVANRVMVISGMLFNGAKIIMTALISKFEATIHKVD